MLMAVHPFCPELLRLGNYSFPVQVGMNNLLRHHIAFIAGISRVSGLSPNPIYQSRTTPVSVTTDRIRWNSVLTKASNCSGVMETRL